MGFSVTATHAILFIAAILIASGVASIATETSDLVQSAILSKSDSNSKKIETSIKIIHVSNTTTITSVFVLNTGTQVLYMNDSSLFLNGIWQSTGNLDFSIVDRSTNIDNGFWDPHEILMINTTNDDLAPGKNKAKVVVQYGRKDEYFFNS